MSVLPQMGDRDVTVPEIEQLVVATGWDNSSPNSLAILRRILRELAEGGVLDRPNERLYRVAARTVPSLTTDGDLLGG